jgi:thiamine biosynthesis protein ThiI
MKLVALLSNGIDSPVAAYLMGRRGADVILLHMDNRPYTDDRSIEVVKSLSERLREVTGKEFPLYLAQHGPNQQIISQKCERQYQCVLCKRMMHRTAREFAKNMGAVAIVMGDSMGQVASQTLKNIRSENVGLDFPVVRPLIGLDKTEITDIAKDIGTFDISIRPTNGCLIVPRDPVTAANPGKVVSMSDDIDLEGLAKKCADEAVRIQ